MSDQAPSPGVPAGWYPEGTNGQRYWDGTAWTDQRAPLAPTAQGKRERNYLGDVALVLGLIGFILSFIVARTSSAGFYFVIAGTGLALVALATAGTRRKRTTAVIALVLGLGIIGFSALVYLAVNA